MAALVPDLGLAEQITPSPSIDNVITTVPTAETDDESLTLLTSEVQLPSSKTPVLESSSLVLRPTGTVSLSTFIGDPPTSPAVPSSSIDLDTSRSITRHPEPSSTVVHTFSQSGRFTPELASVSPVLSSVQKSVFTTVPIEHTSSQMESDVGESVTLSPSLIQPDKTSNVVKPSVVTQSPTVKTPTQKPTTTTTTAKPTTVTAKPTTVTTKTTSKQPTTKVTKPMTSPTIVTAKHTPLITMKPSTKFRTLLTSKDKSELTKYTSITKPTPKAGEYKNDELQAEVNGLKVAVGVLSGMVAFLIIGIILYCVIKKKRRQDKIRRNYEMDEPIMEKKPVRLNRESLNWDRVARSGNSVSNRLTPSEGSTDKNIYGHPMGTFGRRPLANVPDVETNDDVFTETRMSAASFDDDTANDRKSFDLDETDVNDVTKNDETNKLGDV